MKITAVKQFQKTMLDAYERNDSAILKDFFAAAIGREMKRLFEQIETVEFSEFKVEKRVEIIAITAADGERIQSLLSGFMADANFYQKEKVREILAILYKTEL